MRRPIRPVRRGPQQPALITGGAGFIGTNVAARLLGGGRRVRILDNFARPGVARNVRWLCDTYGDGVEIVRGDVTDREVLRSAVAGVDEVYHFAAQVAVTTSLAEPVHDFAVNAGGTLNLLEELRRLPDPPSLLFTSTNKVYGDLEDVDLVLEDARYWPADEAIGQWGIGEHRPIDFHSPYGCSKGAADQYVLDYARTFGLPALVFRMSCIYGPHQCGSEDQGWVAHFLIRAIERQPITIYGDGLQVRDVLYVDDLVDAMLLAQRHVERLAGEAFNIGGGPERATSLVELLDRIAALGDGRVAASFDAWREADQRYYVSDTRKFAAATGWAPRVSVDRGVCALHDWLKRRCAQPDPVTLTTAPAAVQLAPDPVGTLP